MFLLSILSLGHCVILEVRQTLTEDSCQGLNLFQNTGLYWNVRGGSELVLFMKMHPMTELGVDGLCRISRDDWGKEFCLIF